VIANSLVTVISFVFMTFPTGVGIEAMGALGALNSIGWNVSLFWTQSASALLGARVVLAINLGIQILGAVLALASAYSRTYSLLVIGCLLIGLGDVYMPLAVLVSQHFPDSVGLSFGLASSMFTLFIVRSLHLFHRFSSTFIHP
jgi:hypothetical protein